MGYLFVNGHKFSSEVVLTQVVWYLLYFLPQSFGSKNISRILFVITTVDMFRYEKHQGNIMHSWIVIINPTCCMWRDLEVNVTLPYLMKSGYREYQHGKG